MPSAANRIADCSAGAAAAASVLAGAGAAVASSAPRTATTRAREKRRERRRVTMSTFLKPALDTGGRVEPGDPVTLPHRAQCQAPPNQEPLYEWVIPGRSTAAVRSARGRPAGRLGGSPAGRA